MANSNDWITAGALVAIARVFIVLVFLAMLICILLGKISFLIGAGGLASIVVVEVVVAIVKKRQFDRAMKESDEP